MSSSPAADPPPVGRRRGTRDAVPTDISGSNTSQRPESIVLRRGEGDNKAAAAVTKLTARIPAMPLGNLTHQRESQAGARPSFSVPGPVERAEDSLELGCRDPSPVIRHGNPGNAGIVRYAYLRGRDTMPASVFQQISQ